MPFLFLAVVRGVVAELIGVVIMARQQVFIYCLGDRVVRFGPVGDIHVVPIASLQDLR